MTTKQLEAMVNDIKKPRLDRGEVAKLLDKQDFDFVPLAADIPPAKMLAQTKNKPVAQVVAQPVAQRSTQAVAQTVAQTAWVAQTGPQKVAQKGAQAVAQKVPQKVAQSAEYQTQADKDVDLFKEQICQIPSIEGRKRFCLDIGFSIEQQRRGGKAYYLYGIKKLEGKKRRLYIGNSTRL